MKSKPASACAEATVKPGDVVAMIGDSITCDGRWWLPLREQLLARRAAVPCDFRNLGIPGGSAGEARRRYDWDIAPVKASVALVMFGMNDVRRDAYAPAPTAAMMTTRSEALQQFLVNTDTLVARLLADGTRVILLTPTPFDQYTPERPAANLPGVDDALAVAGGMVRGIAVARQLPVIDLHTPLRQRCAAGEAIIGDDRVHPSDCGHEAVAQLVGAVLTPGESVTVPAALRAASRALHAAERRQRLLVMFRCWAEGSEGGTDDEALRRYLEKRREADPNPWVREQARVCWELLPCQAEQAEAVTELRRRLAAEAQP